MDVERARVNWGQVVQQSNLPLSNNLKQRKCLSLLSKVVFKILVHKISRYYGVDDIFLVMTDRIERKVEWIIVICNKTNETFTNFEEFRFSCFSHLSNRKPIAESAG